MHTAMWLGAAKFGARTLRELTDKGLITPREQAAADAALTFLWRVRNELHFFSGHKNDVLTRDLQPRIAKNLGYENDETTLGVERAIEDSLHLVDEAFRRSDGVRELCLDVCRTWGRAAQTFSEMHELGFLGRYLPEFGALTCLVQYDVYHKFSADQHSLLAV